MVTIQDSNMYMVRGDTKAFAFEVEGLDQEFESVKFSCKKKYSDKGYIFQKTLGDGISEVKDGKYIVRIAPEDTEDLPIGDYLYDLEIRANGDVFTILRGKLKIVYDVTREEEE